MSQRCAVRATFLPCAEHLVREQRAVLVALASRAARDITLTRRNGEMHEQQTLQIWQSEFEYDPAPDGG